MYTKFIAEPIMSIDEKLMGIELLTRFTSITKKAQHPEFVISSWDLDRKRIFLYEQCGNIANKKKWFERNNLFCTLNIDQQMAFLIRHDYILRQTFESMPFIKLELSEHFPGLDNGLKSPLLESLSQGVNGLWLDDLGAGNANVVSLIEGYFEVVKIDRIFFNEQVKKTTFHQLIASIKKHCDKIVIEGIEDRKSMEILREAGIWGVQGYLFKSIPFENVDSLV
ncbi:MULTISPECIES: EAL domain-containing protein [Enterobacteriaceae]|uniref:EAL domain-containing protein n=2 Tax=Enterobacteriaceae TaxID=543 RepID=UPI0012BB3DC4|nr:MULTISPECIES: EAL domain-containing protein [Enterobacteriaceae]ELA2476646.1 EAL domain-containing protein [Klebsiella aerogenes]MBW9398454.1 EAL domain-containing protein [Leclercia sp. EC_58]HCM9554083.1 EAL domain-containing protein [Enterobacter kobei]QGP85174.1 EAL domain-containing protein [Leclercia adecarboxylata]QIG34578.1 EAL domain-containing protein [Leclercia adecarboxylata]